MSLALAIMFALSSAGAPHPVRADFNTPTPTPGTKPSGGNLTGIFDIWVDAGTGDGSVALFDCIGRNDHDAAASPQQVKVTLACNSDLDSATRMRATITPRAHPPVKARA